VHLYVDIDECAGPIGDRCRQNGVCDGFNPPGSYTCTCNEGFELNSQKDDCVGQYPNVDSHAYACTLKRSLCTFSVVSKFCEVLDALVGIKDKVYTINVLQGCSRSERKYFGRSQAMVWSS